MAKQELLERDLNTSKEVMKQFEASKKEYVGRLKKELDTVEERFLKVINENNMVGEDYRSQAWVNFDRQTRYKFELGVANQEIQRLNAIIDGKDHATEDLRREIERLSMTIEDALAREIKAEKFVQTFRDDMNKLKSKLEETLDELEIEQDRSAALERELEERQGAAEGFDEREVELKKKIKELEQQLSKKVSPTKIRELEARLNVKKDHKEIQTDEVKFYEKGASDHQSMNREVLQGAMSRNSLVSETHKEGSVRSGANPHHMADGSGLLNDSSTAMNTLAPNNQSLLVDTSGMVHNQSLDAGNPDAQSEAHSPGMRSQRLKGVNDPIQEEEPEGSGNHESNSVHQSKRSGKSVAKGSKMQVNFNGMPSVMSNRTLKPGEQKDDYSSERSKPSLRGSKNEPEKIVKQYENKELQESIRQNNRKVVAPSSIKSLIRSAATRD